MTSLSRRKRRTTARPTTPSRTAIRLAGLAWLLSGGVLVAQQPAAPPTGSLITITPAPDLLPPPPPPKPKAVPTAVAAPALVATPAQTTLFFNKEAAPAPKPVIVPAPKPAVAAAPREAIR